MASAASPDRAAPAAAPLPVKFVIARGFGVGKTTTVASISEIDPLTTEARMTETAAGVDDAGLLPEKTTTTVAMDFGRVTLTEDLRLYLFGTPGQSRFGFMWDDICLGALGAVVLVDPRRITDAFPGLDYFEANAIPFVVGVNVFDAAPRYPIPEIREALGVTHETPIVECDARNKDSVKMVLLTLLEALVAKAKARAHSY